MALLPSCLLLVDLQARLMPAISDSVLVLGSASRLAEAAGHLDIPILATEQNSSRLGATVEVLRTFVGSVFQKQHFDATREDSWRTFWPQGCDDVVICGAETHVCVLQTVKGLLHPGRRVRVVVDAVGSRTAENREIGLRHMEQCGAELVSSEMVIFEWLETSAHPKFRDVLKIIKQVGRETKTNELHFSEGY